MSFILCDIYKGSTGLWESEKYFPTLSIRMPVNKHVPAYFVLGGNSVLTAGLVNDGFSRFIVYDDQTQRKKEVSFSFLQSAVQQGTLIGVRKIKDEYEIPQFTAIGYESCKYIEYVDSNLDWYGETFVENRRDFDSFPFIGIPTDPVVDTSFFAFKCYYWSNNHIGVVASHVFIGDYLVYLFSYLPSDLIPFFVEIKDEYIILKGFTMTMNHKLRQKGYMRLKMLNKPKALAPLVSLSLLGLQGAKRKI